MKWLYLLVFLGIVSIGTAERLEVRYDKEFKIRKEFINLYLEKQDKRFEVRNSTPIITDMIEYNPVINSSGAINFIMRISTYVYFPVVRIGTNTYKVEFSSS